MFQNFFVEDHGKTLDILNDGKFSCAYFVTCILKDFNLIDEIHTTVKDTHESLLRNGWEEVSTETIDEGDVLIWDKEGIQGHIGFAISSKKAISNNIETGKPRTHNIDQKNSKPVSHILRYNFA